MIVVTLIGNEITHKLDVAFDVNISQRHKLLLGPFMHDGTQIKKLVFGLISVLQPFNTF